MFASYKSQSTGNQGEANDIITCYITHKWSPCPGKGKTIWRPTNGQHTMKREVWPCPSIHRHQQELQDPPPCEAGLGLNHPCPPGLCPSFGRLSALTTMMYNDLQGPEAGNETCHPHSSLPAGYQKGGNLERWRETKLQPGPQELVCFRSPILGYTSQRRYRVQLIFNEIRF